MPWLDMVHDMAITENHILLPLGGYIASEEQARTQGGPMWQWDPQAPARIGILRRDGDGSDLRWFTGLKSCQLHTFNAWEEGSRIMLDAPFYDGNPFPFLRSADGSPWSPAYGKAHLRRLHFDLASVENTWREERLFAETVGDLGDVDPRFIGYRHRYCFGGIEAPLPSGATRGPRRSIGWVMPDAWARYDVEARTMSLLRMGDDYAMGECRFVPKAPDAREGEGWLVGVATNMAAGRGELIVADAEHLEDGPLARALLPFPAAPQVHGCWVPAGALALPDLG
jgi:carotenoid cleavage dioxygenase